MKHFEMNGYLYDVDLVSFQRLFENTLTDNAGTTLDGIFHWDARGREVYLATFRAKPNKEKHMADLWYALRKNRIHYCEFPDGTMDAYVQSCRQVLDSTRNGCYWGTLEVRFCPVTVGEDSYGTADQ